MSLIALAFVSFRRRVALGDPDSDSDTFDQPLPILEQNHFSHKQLRARFCGIIAAFLFVDLLLVGVYIWSRYRRPFRAGYIRTGALEREIALESASAVARG